MKVLRAIVPSLVSSPGTPVGKIRPLAILAGLALVLGGCAASSELGPPTDTLPTPVIEAPRYEVLSADPEWGMVTRTFPAPGEAVLFSARGPDSTTLYLAERSGVKPLHVTAGDAVYTSAWSADGSALAFGHYLDAGTASQGRARMGAGDILVYRDGAVARVGCSASRAVLGWASPTSLLVRNTDNLYTVTVDGCDTISSVDARRMLRLTVSPDASHLAFVHRELEYDRTARAYVADSTFRMTAIDGSDPRTVVSFRYRPERLSWRPDGLELAFDVQSPDDPAVRSISIFNVASGQTAYLHPPVAGGTSEYGPVWSPNGGALAYNRMDGGAHVGIGVRTFQTSFPQVIPGSDGGSIRGWASPGTLLWEAASGAVHAFEPSSGQDFNLGAGASVVSAWRSAGG